MSTADQGKTSPRVFISYSWDSDEHRKWVQKFAEELREVGIDARLDKWRKRDQSIDDFMMVELERADYVIAICTPEFKQKLLDHAEGTKSSASGIEMGTAAALLRAEKKSIVPVLVRGAYADATPSTLRPFHNYDLTQGDRRKAFNDLKEHLLGQSEAAPPLGAITPPEQRPELPDIFATAVRESDSERSANASDDGVAPLTSEIDRSSSSATGNRIAWIGAPLLIIAAGAFAATKYWQLWPFDDELINGGTPPVKYFLALEKLELTECEEGFNPLGTFKEEPCIVLNNEAIFGCEIEEFRCGSRAPSINFRSGEHVLAPVMLKATENRLSVYDEDREGSCEKLFRDDDDDGYCDWKGDVDIELAPGRHENVKFKEGPGEYRLSWRVTEQ